ncbi:hypothetical protein KP509_01G120200 [Ceratopteris richardii]|uniref:Uncharacterized protein n=1 Tax=Ceratopteris richardii TaxID=49495 RepID=A0A8T2VQJ1_CERRI|nr:hypothetical protein KP509_01G120200 [Ceratopteris richardii]
MEMTDKEGRVGKGLAGREAKIRWPLLSLGDLGPTLIRDHYHNGNGRAQISRNYGSLLCHLPEFPYDGVLKKHGIRPDWSALCLLECVAHEKQVELFFKIYWGDAREKVCDVVVALPLDCIVLGNQGRNPYHRS